MPEQLDLATPVVITRNALTLQALELNWAGQLITARLVGSDGQPVSAVWSGVQAVTLMTALNSANLSTKSLVKRVFEQLVADNKIPAGTVSGTP